MKLRITSSFVAKAAAAAGLVALGDWLFWQGDGIGSNLGWFAAAWAVATLALAPAARRRWGSLAAWALALLFAAILIDDPGPLAWILFWSALALAVLLPRFAGFDHVGAWALRLGVHGITCIVGPWQDLFRLRLRVRIGGRIKAQSLLALLPLPLIGGAVFLALFANANPVIGDALANFSPPRLDAVTMWRFIFWMALLTMVWAAFRPRRIAYGFGTGPEIPEFELPGVSVASVTLALLTFNTLFALQNGLDLAFLWSGAPLPDGMTLAEYAHRGAYPLIATALLAGLFVLVALRPGSATASVPAIRFLVVLWIIQNVFLVASSILRTIDYIEAYSLTGLRIAALLWMGLVAIGLVLIVWRMLAGKSAGWLINANAALALVVLAGGSAVDIGSVAAAWNVRHAKEAGGKGAELDLCYLDRLGPSALVPIVRLELHGGFDPAFGERLRTVRHRVLAETLEGQKLGTWTWRNQRRLAEIRALLNGTRLPAPPADVWDRSCDGTLPPVAPTEAVLPEAVLPEAPPPVANAADVLPVEGAAPALANAARASEAAPVPPPSPLTKEAQR